MTTTKHLFHLGPLVRVQWTQDGDTPEQARERGSIWLEKPVMDRLRVALLPALCPRADLQGSCWLWTGPLTSDGSGMVYNQDRAWPVHRLLYTIEFGPLSERTHLVTACGVYRCVNPRHFAAVERGPVARPAPSAYTDAVRGRHPRCKYGHPLTPANTYLFQGKAMCRDCRAAAQARYRQRELRKADLARRVQEYNRSSASR